MHTDEEALIIAPSVFAGFRKNERVQTSMPQIQPRAGITVPSSSAKTRAGRKMPLLPVAAVWFGRFLGRSGPRLALNPFFWRQL